MDGAIHDTKYGPRKKNMKLNHNALAEMPPAMELLAKNVF
jgi:hypothetical protein